MLIDAIYGRQSLDKKDSVSIETQIDICKPFIISESHDVYIDKGWSGKNTNRPSMNKLIQDIKDGKIKRVICYRLDRISRNIVDFGNLLTLFDKHGVEFVSATENFDTSSPIGRAMVYIVMVFAQLERETTATRITDNYKFRCATGKFFMGGNVPYGYKSEKSIIDGKKASIIVPNENAEILKNIFQKYITGYSFYQIVHELNNNGIRTATGKLWSPIGVKRILKNITPCTADEQIYNYLSAFGYNITNPIDDFDGEHGMCIFLKNKNRNEETLISEQIVAVGIHQPIISSDIYIKAQMLLNKEVKQGKRSNRSFLAGLIKCKECGYSFGLKTTTNKKKTYAYYCCRSRQARGVCTNDLYINSEELEEYVVKRCVNYLKIGKIKLHKSTKKINNTANEVEILEQQIVNLIDNIGKGNNVVDKLLTDKITDIQNQISKIKQSEQLEIHKVNTNDEKELLLESLLDFKNINIQDKIAVIRKIIDYITVSKDNEIDIKYLV